MRNGIVPLALLTAAASQISAQPNPFKLPKSTIKAHVAYQLTGDQKGTSETAFDGNRTMTKTSSTIKMMGKETRDAARLSATSAGFGSVVDRFRRARLSKTANAAPTFRSSDSAATTLVSKRPISGTPRETTGPSHPIRRDSASCNLLTLQSIGCR